MSKPKPMSSVAGDIGDVAAVGPASVLLSYCGAGIDGTPERGRAAVTGDAVRLCPMIDHRREDHPEPVGAV
jgi:hypothetical protein